MEHFIAKIVISALKIKLISMDPVHVKLNFLKIKINNVKNAIFLAKHASVNYKTDALSV